MSSQVEQLESDIPYGRELVRLGTKRASGTLILTYRDQRREVHLRDGKVAFATTTVETERIGRLLVRSGDLEDKDVTEALANLAPPEKGGELIGEWLVKNNRLSRSKLQWGLKQQCERLVEASFAWPAAELEFSEELSEPRGYQDFGIPMINVVLEGARRFLPPALAIDVLNGIGERCELADEHAHILRDVRIGTEEERVLGLLDGKRTAEEIARLTLLDTDDVYKITAGFALIGAIKVPGPRPIWDRSTDRIDVRVWDQETDPEIAARRKSKPPEAPAAAVANPDPQWAASSATDLRSSVDDAETTTPAADATPVMTPDPTAIARDALPSSETVLMLNPDKATKAWHGQLDTATESLLVWFDGERTVGDVLDTLGDDPESLQAIARLVRDGYLTSATGRGSQNGAGNEDPAVRSADEELRRLQQMAPPQPDSEPESDPAEPSTGEQSLAEALLQQADRLVAAGARAVEAGNYGHAARFFQRALRKSPDHADALLGLGTSRYGMNDRSGARIAWESFLRVEPEGDLSRRIRTVLETL